MVTLSAAALPDICEGQGRLRPLVAVVARVAAVRLLNEAMCAMSRKKRTITIFHPGVEGSFTPGWLVLVPELPSLSAAHRLHIVRNLVRPWRSAEREGPISQPPVHTLSLGSVARAPCKFLWSRGRVGAERLRIPAIDP